MGTQLYIGENCHAEAVVFGGDEHPELVAKVIDEVEEAGWQIDREAFFGHFMILGASHDDEGQPTFTADEVVALAEVGEVIKIAA